MANESGLPIGYPRQQSTYLKYGLQPIEGGTVAARCIHTGGVPAMATGDGTNIATNTANTIYLAEMFVPANTTATGIAVFNGTAVAGNGKVLLYKRTGATTGVAVAQSATTAMSGTTAYQLIPFTATIDLQGPGTYFVGVIYDDTTHDLRGHTLGAFATGNYSTSVVYATDSTLQTVTLPTTFGTAGHGPFASLY